MITLPKKISEKKFVYIIIGLCTTNVLGSVVIPAHLGLASNHNSPITFFSIKLIESHIFAVLGLFYNLPWSLSLPSANPYEFMLLVLLTLSIISIPFTIILSKGIRKYKRVFFVYLIHLEILTLFTWWWVPNFGFS